VKHPFNSNEASFSEELWGTKQCNTGNQYFGKQDFDKLNSLGYAGSAIKEF
jgi:hypothetical protein